MNNQMTIRRKDLLYPDLSYRINGALFEVFKQIGGGHREEYFQKAAAEVMRNKKINFVEQYFVPIKINNSKIGRYFADFLIENKIVLELKRGRLSPSRVVDQVEKYLEALNLELALVACFTYNGVLVKRIINKALVPKTLNYVN